MTKIRRGPLKTRSKELYDVAKSYIDDVSYPVSCALISGSVARGEADSFSDVDITIYTNDKTVTGQFNLEYKGEILQIAIMRSNRLPTQEMVYHSPWDYRFLVESLILTDTNSYIYNLREVAKEYLVSEKGMQKMLDDVSNIVRKRTNFAKGRLKEKNNFSAAHAAMGAWAEAAFLHLFFMKNSVSTGEIIPNIHKICGHYQEFASAVPFPAKGSNIGLAKKINQFRSYLRQKGHSFEFGLSPLQDRLCDQKAQRMMISREPLSLKWQLYGEAFWLYMETSNGLAIEPYVRRLPLKLQQDLEDIGLASLEDSKVLNLCSLSWELLYLSERKIEEKASFSEASTKIYD